MEKRIKKFLQSKFFKFTGMPILLFLLWAGLTLQYIVTFDSSLLILPFNHPLSAFKTLTFSPLLKGQKIVGEFTAQGNYLGIVQMRFNYHKRIAYKDEDTLLFRIKEKGATNWYYQGKYRSGLMTDVPFLPFGFPVITDSRGKTYDFELISENGTSENAVSIKNRWPVLISKYKVIKSTLLHNNRIVTFITKKYIRGLENIDIFFSSVAYALPLLFYFLLLSPAGPVIKKPMRIVGVKMLDAMENTKIFGVKLRLVSLSKTVVVSYFDIVLLLFVLVDILIMQVPNDMVYVVILFLWWYFSRFQKRGAIPTFIVGLGFIILAPFLLAVNLYLAGEKSAIWGYMFLASWFIQLLASKQARA